MNKTRPLTGAFVKCVNCKKEIYRRPSLLKRSKFFACSKHCLSTVVHTGIKSWNKGKKLHYQVWNKGIVNPNISMEKHPMWRGGLTKMKIGYMQKRTQNKKYMLEHRLVMETHLGRNLLAKEVVHHINHDRSDNRIENLILFPDHSSHMRHHASLRK